MRLGFIAERAGDRDALLLAAGEAVRVLVGLVLEADERKELASPAHARRAFDSLSACIGARVTFSITVMCGNRLYAWKTIPIFRRSAFTSTFVPRDDLAVDDDRPVVDLLEQVHAAEERRLARPRGADQADDLMEVDRQVDPVQHLEVAEALRDVLERDEVRVRADHTAWARSRCSRSLIEVVGEAGERDREDDEEHGRDREARVVEVVGGVEARLRSRLGEPEDGDERGVLLQADEVVQERRDDAPDRLRQDDEAESLRCS